MVKRKTKTQAKGLGEQLSLFEQTHEVIEVVIPVSETIVQPKKSRRTLLKVAALGVAVIFFCAQIFGWMPKELSLENQMSTIAAAHDNFVSPIMAVAPNIPPCLRYLVLLFASNLISEPAKKFAGFVWRPVYGWGKGTLNWVLSRD